MCSSDLPPQSLVFGSSLDDLGELLSRATSFSCTLGPAVERVIEPLLRELANAHFEIDDLPAAEMLLRRSLMAQDSPHTRARLADVLKMQNKPADLPQQELA